MYVNQIQIWILNRSSKLLQDSVVKKTISCSQNCNTEEKTAYREHANETQHIRDFVTIRYINTHLPLPLHNVP